MSATSEDAAQPGARTGRGSPLVLLHGGGPGVDAASNWATVRPRLSARFRCLAPDLLGFGTQLTGGAAGAGGLQGPRAWARARARQVLDLLDRHGLERVHLLGNSAAGGAAALALMAEAPERIERAVLMGGAGTGPLPRVVPFYGSPTRESMRATLGRLVADEGAHRELLDGLAGLRLEQALRPGAEAAFRSMFTEVADGPPPADLARIATPVLALHGERDRVAPVDVSARLVEALPCGRLEIVAGAGHWIHVDRPDEFCTLVGEFLSI
ncbi:alpha/beta fold hydrolase [Streptomyces shenzhenensis]|uniref:2-hydroxy-6-oxo-6-phenylhexa-2,4-dienoate hydrolase n=1 Tax=Streptomyces shenzhenensis TaxID=943815 RepID=A0A3M0I5K1_9ACTN|nr:alpha/beta hydrolase [Streptomyces shenzhenensis]RMB84145.1 2-hydroxy-6-oxo-6-phenylhexa-2,4-dienoate hydrolase [Streptomyces shenzhenensis]